MFLNKIESYLPAYSAIHTFEIELAAYFRIWATCMRNIITFDKKNIH
jgi:hypothetical protein